MLRLRSALVALALVAAAAAIPPRAVAAPHPLFDDGGTLVWFTSLSAAQDAAEAQGKLIFIDSGRLHCPNCRALISQVLPSAAVRSRISAVAVGLADDCDEGDPRVQAILEAGVPGAPTLPIVGFVTANLRWVTGWYGYASEGEVCARLSIAEQRLAYWKKCRADAKKPVSTPPQKPAVVPAPDFRPRPAPPPPAPPIAVKPAPAPTPAPIPAPTPFPSRAEETPRALAKATPLPAPLPPQRAAPDPSSLPPPIAIPPPEHRPLAVLPPAPAPAPVPAPAPTKPPPATLRIDPSPTLDPCAGGQCKAPPRGESPAPERRVAERAPARAATPLPAAPAPRRVPATSSTTGVLARDLLLAAREAAAAGSWKDVLSASDAAAKLPRDADTLEIALLAQKAQRWAYDSLQSAADGAILGRYGQAITTLESVRREMVGRVQEIDAERGVHAVEQRIAIERGTPDDGEDLDQVRRKAYSEYRGTRWAALFRPARSSTADLPAILSPR